jgi:xylulokinase
MGGISAIRRVGRVAEDAAGRPPLSYDVLDALLAQAPEDPTGILYFPYLAGSGSPHSYPQARAGLVGFGAGHGRAALAKAVLEGTAYELEYIRRAAEGATGLPIDRLRVTGGGTRNRAWMQIKADVSGCRLELLSMPESTLLGAALLAGIGAGLFGDPVETFRSERWADVSRLEVEVVLPDLERHRRYRELYAGGYLKLQEPLRSLARTE